MHRRRHQRVKRRFSCEFLAEGQRYRGIIVELSPSGLFVQTDATTTPGAEVDLHLAGAGAVPDLRLRAIVVRRRMVPAPLATAVRRGIALELLEAPREYGLACGSELLEVPIRVTRRGGGGSSGTGIPEPARSDREAPDAELPERKVPLATTARVAGRASAPESSRVEPDEPPRPEVLLVDDGTLSDVDALLGELAVDARRLHHGADALAEPLQLPTRLFVTTARLASSFQLPALGEDDGLIAIAVADDRSQTLSTLMRRLGFQYLVHRPTHPEALRLLLRRCLYRGAEQRRAERFPFGSEVTWRIGWRKRRGPMVEISATGCRLHSAQGARPGQRIRICIPAEATGERRIVLRGRIARREARLRASDREDYALAVAFQTPSARMQRRLEALLARNDRGPATLPRTAPPAGGAAAPAPSDIEPVPAVAAPVAALEPSQITTAALDARAADAAPEPTPDRRRVPRVRLEREVVALDETGARALHALVGRDLSPLGMRVDPHPELALQQRLRLALYEPSVGKPVLLEAEVARDDGEAGLALRFVDVASELAAEIACIVASLPAAESLRPEPRRIVLGEYLLEPHAA